MRDKSTPQRSTAEKSIPQEPILEAVSPWDREVDLDQARAQVRKRVEGYAAARRGVLWLDAGSGLGEQVDSIAGLGPDPVVGSDMVLWTWTPQALARLSAVIAANEGTLVFVEPTAGLGARRMLQLAGGRWFERVRGHHYRRDIPAELRSAGFSVTTQVRLRHRFVGDYVRGEARHF